jgi:CTP synthase
VASAIPEAKSPKYIFVTGGVISSLGKGIFAASLGHLLKLRGVTVTLQKLDPYLNVDPGTMSPYQHGEVFVTDDGAETDLDIGHYERFLDQNLTRSNSVSSGQIYLEVITKERRGDYLGATVQVIPHITGQIKEVIHRVSRESAAELIICEVGGTVGDIEGQPFLEAIRQFSNEVGREHCMVCHLTLVPYMGTSGELKTKPTQHSVKELLSIGIVPDMIVCRSERSLNAEAKAKISSFCNVPADYVVESHTQRSIYEVPGGIAEEGCAELVARRLGLKLEEITVEPYQDVLEHLHHPKNGPLKVAVVGKYTGHSDAYMSIHESLIHAAMACSVDLEIQYLSSSEEDQDADITGFHGVLVPGGFGDRGIEGKIHTIQKAREGKLPFLGICLGMQCAVSEFARNVLELPRANSMEFDPDTPDPVVHLMDEQQDLEDKGATMRLGLYPAHLRTHSLLSNIYSKHSIEERHRHRYEVNNEYRVRLEKAGLIPSAISPDQKLVEGVELEGHPFFVGVQYHPEFLSRPNRPHPLFKAFVAAMRRYRDGADS